jgi:threonine synthase
MDIQVSSNFERLLFDAYGHDGKAIRALMNSLAQSQSFAVSARALTEMRALFSADRADEAEVFATIRRVHHETGMLIDPHTAVAVAVAQKNGRGHEVPMVVLATAHPAKFPETVEAACGARPALPDWLADLPDRPERITPLPPDQAEIEKFILAASRAAREGAAA